LAGLQQGTTKTVSSSSLTNTGGTRMQPNYSAFAIPPPPSTTTPRQPQTMSIPTLQSTAGFNSNQNQWGNLSSAFPNSSGSLSTGQQKQGLDKYESLL
jgi:SCY1-like protein 2